MYPVSAQEYERVCALTREWKTAYVALQAKLKAALEASAWCDSCEKMQAKIRTLQVEAEKRDSELAAADQTIREFRAIQRRPSPASFSRLGGKTESLWLNRSSLTREQIFQRVQAEAATFADTDQETKFDITAMLDTYPELPFQQTLGRKPGSPGRRPRPGAWSISGLEQSERANA